MIRILILSILFVAAIVLVDVRATNAGISRNNPYRSFNISGFNYGSTQWEKSHGKKSWSSIRKGNFHFRRR